MHIPGQHSPVPGHSAQIRSVLDEEVPSLGPICPGVTGSLNFIKITEKFTAYLHHPSREDSQEDLLICSVELRELLGSHSNKLEKRGEKWKKVVTLMKVQ